MISNDGYILTNNHVVENGNRFLIEFSDRSVVEASLVGGDSETDIAVLKVPAKPSIKPLSLADSNQLRTGETVIAIGNPYGVGQTVTTGIVSAKGRSLGNSNYVDYIQTDAPINQGNSGGPLLNAAGQVIGINTAIYSPSGGSVGIGFAVPSNTVKRIVGQLKKNGRVTRGYLGIGIQDVTPAIASSMDLAKSEGAIVTAVSKGSPSFGKLKPGDIITKFDSIPIRTARDLSKAAAFAEIGESTKYR
ncbi:hypothetical protein C8024_05915 [Sphingopyxis sp. BSNA05]|nr:hypothetical protein [Sphingopyxis sp. BSNA05]